MTAPQQHPAPDPPQPPPGGLPLQGAPPVPPQPAGAGSGTPAGRKRAHFGHALLSEWTKIRTVRSTVWTLGIMFALVIGIGFLMAYALSSLDYTGMPLLSSGLFGLMLGQVCIVTLGVLVITSEYSTGMIRTTLTACPQRGRVLLAKAAVFFALAFVTTTVACAVTALISSQLLSGQKPPPGAGSSGPMQGFVENGKVVAGAGEWLGATVGTGLYVALLGLLSLAVGALLRHSAGAITSMLGLVLLMPVIPMFLPGQTLSWLRSALIEYSPLNALSSLYRMPMTSDTDATGWPLTGLLAAVTAVALAAAYGLLHKRDV